MQIETIVENFAVEKLPVLSACYCAKCKMPLQNESMIDSNHAWCPACNESVTALMFQVPSWTVGVTTFLFLTYFLF